MNISLLATTEDDTRPNRDNITRIWQISVSLLTAFVNNKPVALLAMNCLNTSVNMITPL